MRRVLMDTSDDESVVEGEHSLLGVLRDGTAMSREEQSEQSEQEALDIDSSDEGLPHERMVSGHKAEAAGSDLEDKEGQVSLG